MCPTTRPASIAVSVALAALVSAGCTAAESEEWDVTLSVGGFSTAPFGTRVDHSLVWTGTELFVWGGSSKGGTLHDGGAVYSPDTDTWRVTADTDLRARARHSTVPLGDRRVLVWGGATGTRSEDRGGRVTADGAIYDSGLDSWERVSDAPQAREFASAIVVGDHVVFGGGGYEEDLLVYSLENDTWDTVAVTGAGERFRLFDLVAVDDGVLLVGATFEHVFTGWFRLGDTSAPAVEFEEVGDPTGTHVGLAALPGGRALLAVEESRGGRLYELDGRGRVLAVHEDDAFRPPVHEVSHPLLSGEMGFVDGLGVFSANAGEISLWDEDTGLARRWRGEALDGYCGPVEPVGADALIGWGGRCETGQIRIDVRA